MNVLDSTTFRVCSKCRCTKPATLQFFGRPRANSKQLNRICKVCTSLYAAHRRQVRKYWLQPEVKQYKVEWRKKNIEKVRTYFRNWNQENRESVREYSREWRKANKGKLRTYGQKRREAHLEAERLAKRVREQKRRAIKAHAGGTHEPADVEQMCEDQKGLCAYCETPLFGSFHVDHMTPLSRGGNNNWDNIAIACPYCNSSKHNKTAEEFMNQLLSNRAT